MKGMINRGWGRWSKRLGFLSSMAGSIVGLLLLWGNNASAATYGAHEIDRSSNMMLTWVLFDQPQGAIWGYACEVPPNYMSNAMGVPTFSASDSGRITATVEGGSTLSGYSFGVSRYAIVWDGTRFRTEGLHSAAFAVWDEYRGQPNYYWRTTSLLGGAHTFFEILSDINPQTGWFDNNTTISPLGRACVNGGISAATELVERELGVRFVQHEEFPL